MPGYVMIRFVTIGRFKVRLVERCVAALRLLGRSALFMLAEPGSSVVFIFANLIPNAV